MRFFIGSTWTPAYILVPLAVLRELIHANLSRGMSPVAHWAHLGGFAGGFAIAAVLGLTGYERRFLTPIRATVSPTVALARVTRARKAGRIEEARAELGQLAATHGRSTGYRVEFIRTLAAAEDRKQAGDSERARAWREAGSPATSDNVRPQGENGI